jgi:hypothetical protein
MLKPAILYKEEIIKNFQEYFYTDDMMYETGSLHNWCPDISDEPDACNFQYAIVHNEKLIGYMSYTVDWYSSKAYNFGLFSFDRGNVIVGKEVFTKLEELVNRLHRVEWRMVSGNPAERSYDAFCERHNGTKHVLKDAIKDRDDNYRDDVIYEIVKCEN